MDTRRIHSHALGEIASRASLTRRGIPPAIGNVGARRAIWRLVAFAIVRKPLATVVACARHTSLIASAAACHGAVGDAGAR